MISIKRVGALFGWVVGGTFTAAMIAYAILLVINWKDQPPSVSTSKLTQLYQNRQHVTDNDNAYIFMLGFSCAPNASPMQAGLERKEWIRQALADPTIDTDTDPLAIDFDYRVERDEGVVVLFESCNKFNLACQSALETGHDTILEWQASEQWLLDRYKSLLAFNGFFEAMPFDVRTPLPSYSSMLDGQKLLFVQSWMLAGRGDSAQVRAMLDKDLIFWRMVLVNSDYLITKMIATAALSRHFKMANLVFRNTPPNLIGKSVPPSWQKQIDRDERSMQRSFVGEWIHANRSINNTTKEGINLLLSDDESDKYLPLYYILWKLIEPLLQPQESTNIHADMMLKLSELFDTPYEDVDDALVEASDIDYERKQPLQRAYNLIGDLLMQEYSSFARYAVRVADLEGLRRIALLSAQLRASGINSNAVAAQLEFTNIKNPYTNDSFEWDNERNSIIFTGLESSDRGRHVLVY